jgi:hypothetical protein
MCLTPLILFIMSQEFDLPKKFREKAMKKRTRKLFLLFHGGSLKPRGGMF